VEERDLIRLEMREALGEPGDPALPGALEDSLPLCSRVHTDDAAVARIRRAPREARLLEALHDLRHRGGADLLRSGELAQRLGTAEDEHRECRETCGAQATRGILASNVSEGVNRRRMEAVGGT
jgi:hypothetical protein